MDSIYMHFKKQRWGRKSALSCIYSLFEKEFFVRKPVRHTPFTYVLLSDPFYIKIFSGRFIKHLKLCWDIKELFCVCIIYLNLSVLLYLIMSIRHR